MSTTLTTPTETNPEDLKAFVEARNKGQETPKPAAATAEPAKPAEPAEPAEPDHEQPRQSRSQRRQLNQAIREAAEARGRLAAYEELMAAGKLQAPGQTTAPAEDAEPQRKDFASDAEYLRATQKWDKAQDAKEKAKAGDQGAQQEQFAAHLKAMDEKAQADLALIPDWDETAKAAAEDEDAPEFAPDDHPTLMAMLAQSDVRAFALHHFAKNPDELQAMLDMTKTPDKQIRAFHRLEGRLEREYADRKAAQAAPEKGKTADTPQKPQGRAEPQQEAQPAKPKPSSEVAARGGSPAPDEPAIGSPAWMLKRNQQQYGR